MGRKKNIKFMTTDFIKLPKLGRHNATYRLVASNKLNTINNILIINN